MEVDTGQVNKAHRKRSDKGRKASEVKKLRLKKGEFKEEDARKRNPKAFSIQKVGKAERRVRRKEDITEKRKHLPKVDRTPLEPPPVVVAIVGPPKVGKSTLLRGLVRNFTRQALTDVRGPVTLVSGKRQRLTLLECSNDINAMVDVAKVADLVLILVDASFGFEMEVFEFLNICQVHGFPRVMGVLTHLDSFKNTKALQKTKKTMKHRFWTDVYQGAKLFYLSGMVRGEYQKTEIHNLGRFISVMKFRPLTWRESHPYLLADRMEDLTNPEEVRLNAKCDRRVSLYGYVRGTNLKANSAVHIPGCGDFGLNGVVYLPDPCPMPETVKKKRRTLQEKEKNIYAPMSGVGGIVYDKDAVYIELGGSHSHGKRSNVDLEAEDNRPSSELVRSMIDTERTLDEKMEESQVRIFSDSMPIRPEYVEVLDNGKVRRKVVFSEDSDKEDSIDDDSASKEDLESDDDESEKDEAKDKGGSKTGKPPRKKSKTTPEGLSFDSDASSPSSEAAGENPLETKTLSQKKARAKTGPTKKKAAGELDDKSKIADALAAIEAMKQSHSRSDAYKDVDSDDEKEKDSEESESSEEESSEEEEEASSERWKQERMKEASDAFYQRASNPKSLRKLVYGSIEVAETHDEEEDQKEDFKDLLRVVKSETEARSGHAATMNQPDCSLFWSSGSGGSGRMLHDWSLEEVKDSIRDCFVTGKWGDSEDAEALLKMDQEDDDDVFGDFEDLETGEVHKAQDKAAERDDEDAPRVIEDEKEVKKKRLEEKKRLKAKFDLDYDDGEKSHYDDLKKEVDQQTMLNRTEFEGLDDSLRVQYEGFRPGMYVRLEISKAPCELVTNFDPTYPLVVGGLQSGEDQIGYVQARMKKHRWYPKILKSRDPLIVSLGWRRFQTLPVLAVTEHNMRHRAIKYTPQHIHCAAHMWAPLTPQGTGFLALQTVSEISAGFRIAATGVVLEMDKSTQVVKKLKLTGEPYKTFKKTAFIKGMFNTALEVSKFEGAAIRTVSGVRGQIKRGLSKPEGAFRATFEDKILMSDLVFVRTWFTVPVPHFFAPVTNLLMPLEEKCRWRGARTVAQIKRERGVRAPAREDSAYTEVEREPRVFAPLTVPRNLQKDLPYSLKPKFGSGKGRDPASERVSVELDSKERKARRLMKMLSSVAGEREAKLAEEKSRRVQELIRRQEAVEERKFKRQKEARKQIARTLSKERARKERLAERGGGGHPKKRKRKAIDE